MSAMSDTEIVNELESLLRELDLAESYGIRSALPNSAHSRVIDAFRDYWFGRQPYIERYSQQYIDFIGKDGQAEGHIIVAMEVDAKWHGGQKNCVKLANIRARNKIWIHISNSEDAKENFQKALKKIHQLIQMRGETKELFGNFEAFLKTPRPEDFERVKIL